MVAGYDDEQGVGMVSQDGVETEAIPITDFHSVDDERREPDQHQETPAIKLIESIVFLLF